MVIIAIYWFVKLKTNILQFSLILVNILNYSLRPATKNKTNFNKAKPIIPVNVSIGMNDAWLTVKQFSSRSRTICNYYY